MKTTEQISRLLREYTKKLRDGNDASAMFFSDVAEINLAAKNNPSRFTDDGFPRIYGKESATSFLELWEDRRKNYVELAGAASALLDSSDVGIVDRIELKLRLNEYEHELTWRELNCQKIADQIGHSFTPLALIGAQAGT